MAVSNTSALVVCTVAALSILAGYGLHAYAEGAPTTKPIFYAGTLEANGTLAKGAHTISLSLFDAEMAGKQLCVSDTPDTPVENGRFRVEVSADCVATLKAQPDVWAALKFTGPDGVPHELPKRSKIGAVPYAMEAQHAVNATLATSATTAVTANAAGGSLASAISGLQGLVHPASGFRAWASTARSVATGVATTILFDQVDFDLASEYDPATGIFSPKQAGVYIVNCGAWFLSSGETLRYQVQLFSGSTEVAGYDSAGTAAGNGVSAAVSTVLKLAAGEHLVCQAGHSAGAAQSLSGGLPRRNHFDAARLY